MQLGLMRVQNNEEIETARQEQEALSQEAPIIGLSAYLGQKWEQARQAKEPIVREMLRSLRQRNGEYEPDKLTSIRSQGGSEIKISLTATKCRALESWLSDILNSTGEKPWKIDATPVPDMPPDVMLELQQFIEAGVVSGMIPSDPRGMTLAVNEIKEQVLKQLKDAAELAASRMEDEIYDQMEEGGWRLALAEFITDIATFQNAFMRGPVIRRKKTLKWVQFGEEWKPEVGDELRHEIERVSGFDIYPSPDARNINDGYLFERFPLTRKYLRSLIGVDGFSKEAIEAVLEEYGRGGLRDWLYHDQERAWLENREYEWLNSGSDKIESLLFWGPIQGKLLLEWGMDESQVPDPLEEYDVTAWKIGRYIVGVSLNADPLGRRPYHTAWFQDVPGSFWKKGLPEVMRDLQAVCDALGRAIVNNAAIASGPIVEVQIDKLAPGESATDIHPWRVFQTLTDESGQNRQAVHFNQPTIIQDQLMRTFEYFSKLADDYTGVPAYSYGSTNVAGAGKTASGLSMLFGAASKGIKLIVSCIDLNVIEKVVEKFYYWNMLNSTDQSIKGDLKVKARGATSMIMKESIQMRRNDFLAITNNPVDNAIVGMRGRAAFLRKAVEDLEMDPDLLPKDIDFQVGPGDTTMTDQPGGQPGPEGGPEGGQPNI